MARQPRRIGLVLSYSQGYCRGILRGVKAYAESMQGWVFSPVEPDAADMERLRAFRPAGIIAQVFNDEITEALASFRRSLVNVSGVMPDLPFPRVGCDDPQAGRLAADHLLDRCFRRFGFAGQPTHAYSNRREEGFRGTIESAGYTISCHHEREPTPFDPRGRLWALDTAVRRWMASLPRPAGVFVPNDMWGLQLTEVCRQERLRVPEDVAIVGVDNDDLLCKLARPALSSVVVPADRIGFEAARLLGSGRPSPPPRRCCSRLPGCSRDAPRTSCSSRTTWWPRRSGSSATGRTGRSGSAMSPTRPLPPAGCWRGDSAPASVAASATRSGGRGCRGRCPCYQGPSCRCPRSPRSGFSESKRLSIVFRREAVMTPSSYRRHHRRNGRMP